MMEDGTLMDKDSNVLDVNVSGNVPEEDSWIKVVKGQVVAYSLKFGDYVVTKLEDSDAEAVKNGTIETDESVTEITDSIKLKYSNEAKLEVANYIASLLGDSTVQGYSNNISKIDGTSYTVRLANTSSCPDDWPQQASRTACGVVIEFVDTITFTSYNNNEGYVMNSKVINAGGWPASEMRSYLNTTIFNKLPNELKANGMILSTQTVSGHEQGVSTNYTSNNKLYLLSYVEILGSNNDWDSVKLVSDTVLDGTRQLEYYGLPDSTGVKTKPDGSATTWWLRSAYSTSTVVYLYVSNLEGTIHPDTADTTYGVAPAFRILD